MSTDHKDRNIYFAGLSVGNVQTLSSIGAATETYGGISINGGFNPRRQLDPNAATLVQVNQVLATVIMDLYKSR